VKRLKLKTKRLQLKSIPSFEKEFYGNIFDYIGIVDVICIPTNNYVNSDGENVMGKGIALQAKSHFPSLPKDIGTALKFGPTTYIVKDIKGTKIVTFPTKPQHCFVNRMKSNIVAHVRKKYNYKDKVPGYYAKSNLSMIEQSAYAIEHLAKILNWRTIIIPKVGCGAGELDWEEDIKPLFKRIGFYNNSKIFFCLGEEDD
jgi:hypothetical protein